VHSQFQYPEESGRFLLWNQGKPILVERYESAVGQCQSTVEMRVKNKWFLMEWARKNGVICDGPGWRKLRELGPPVKLPIYGRGTPANVG